MKNDVTNTEKSQNAHSATRRVIPRYHRRMAIRYSIGGGAVRTFRGYSKDVGPMGLQVLSTHKEQVGQKVLLEVALPDKKVVRLEGMVRWTKWVPQKLQFISTSGFGVQITNAPEEWFSYFMSLDGAA